MTPDRHRNWRDAGIDIDFRSFTREWFVVDVSTNEILHRFAGARAYLRACEYADVIAQAAKEEAPRD